MEKDQAITGSPAINAPQPTRNDAKIEQEIFSEEGETRGEQAFNSSPEAKRREAWIVWCQILSFVVMLLSAFWGVFDSSSPWVSLMGCVGLSIGGISNFLAHKQLQEQRRAIDKENINLLVDVNAQDQEAAKTLSRRLFFTRTKMTVPSIIRIGEYFFQIVGYVCLAGSGIVAFLPGVAKYNALLTQVGWTVFTIGTQLSTINDRREKLGAKHVNRELRHQVS